MDTIGNTVAKNLLQIKAIKLEPANHFTWASGWNSPIYCDNRKTLSYPEVRKLIARSFVGVIKKEYAEVEVIAGVATGAIAIGILVAEEMGLPFVYVRPEAKKHGLTNQVEGHLEEGKKVVVIEDLISTGGSSLKAVEALRGANAELMGMVAIFTYGFQLSEDNFENAKCKLVTLSNYDYLIDEAVKTGYVSEKDVELLKEWRKAPDQWKK